MSGSSSSTSASVSRRGGVRRRRGTVGLVPARIKNPWQRYLYAFRKFFANEIRGVSAAQVAAYVAPLYRNVQAFPLKRKVARDFAKLKGVRSMTRKPRTKVGGAKKKATKKRAVKKTTTRKRSVPRRPRQSAAEVRRLDRNAKKRSYTAKYLARPSPAMSAREADLIGKRLQRGNDGHLYRVQHTSAGVPRWVRAH